MQFHEVFTQALIIDIRCGISFFSVVQNVMTTAQIHKKLSPSCYKCGNDKKNPISVPDTVFTSGQI